MQERSRTMARRTSNHRMGNRSNRRRLENDDDNHSWGPWAELPHDILLTILMMLGVIDYLNFSGVCMSWRSLALSHREAFFTQKKPLKITLLKRRNSYKRACILESIFDNGRRYKTMLPGTSRGSLLGVSCGYLILLTRTNKFSIVNPITRHQLPFPVLPNTPSFFSGLFRAVLVYSSLLSKLIIVVLSGIDNLVQFCKSGDSQWVVLPKPGNDWSIVDLIFFMGKIYILNHDGRIGEIRLNPMHNLQFLDVKRVPRPKDGTETYKWHSRHLVTSSSKLFMVDHLFSATVNYELDFENMEWVLREDLGEDTLFISHSSAVVSYSNWKSRERAHCKSTYFLGLLGGSAWYFPHECYAYNVLDD